MYMRAAKQARAVQHPDPSRPPVVFEVGGTKNSMRKIQLLRADPRNVRIAVHVCLPPRPGVSSDVPTTEHSGLQMVGCNYLPETRKAKLSAVNYCRHTPEHCDCLRFYQVHGRFAVSSHSVYNLRPPDWARLFQYVDHLEVAAHIPKVGMSVPLQDPEFHWEDASQDKDTDWATRLGCKVKAWLTGRRTVVFKPNRVGAKTYCHEDISQDVEAGGFHLTGATIGLSPWVQGDGKTVAAIAATAGTAMLAAGAAAVVANCAPPAIALAAVSAGIRSTCLTALWVRAEHERARLSRPLFVKSTVSIACHSAYGVGPQSDHGHILRYTHGPPRKLVPNVVQSTRVDTTHLGRVTAGIAMAKNRAVAAAQMAASLWRNDVPTTVVKATVQHAQNLVELVVPNDPPPPPEPSPWRWAILSLPFAWGVGAVHSLALAAKSYMPMDLLTASANSPAVWLQSTLFLLSCILSIWWIRARPPAGRAGL